jgi:hypothetical protein
MARDEADREDLLSEARALVERAEVIVSGFDGTIVLGFRRDGAWSFFFDGDPAFHFNARSELRRVFAGGRLIKAESNRLVAMDRQRTAEEVVLLSRPLSKDGQTRLLRELESRLAALQSAIENGQLEVVGQVPADGAVIEAARHWLANRSRPIRIANSPGLAGR